MSKQGQPPSQDWTPVSINKAVKPMTQQEVRVGVAKGALKKEIIGKEGAAKNTQIKSDIDARKIEESEIGHHQTPSHNLAIQIAQARNAKNFTQTQLNNLCNFPKGTVAGYENGKAIVDSVQLQAMSRQLGITLKKKS